MFRAISGGLSLAVFIIVMKAFLPEVADELIELTVKVLSVMNVSVDNASSTITF